MRNHVLATILSFEKAVARRTRRRERKSLEVGVEAGVSAMFRRERRVVMAAVAAVADTYPIPPSESVARLREANEQLPLWPGFDAAIVAALAETTQAWVGLLRGTAARAVAAGARVVLGQVGVALSFDLRNLRAEEWAERHAAVRVTQIQETTRQYIHTTVRRGMREGWSYDRVAAALTERYAEFSIEKPQKHIDTRAHLIAVTEVGDAYSEGGLRAAQAIQRAGVPMEKKWDTVGDGRVSAGCAANEHAGWIGVRAAFPSGHQRPLRFPGCRCDLLTRPAADEDGNQEEP